MDLSKEKNYKLHSFFHSFSFRFIPEETFQVSITQIDRSIRSSGKRSALVMLLTYSVNGAELGIYFRVRSVLVKLQPAFQSLHQVEDSSNQSPASKQSWNSFVPHFSNLSIHLSLSLQTHIRTFRFRIENGERERKR